MRNFSLPHHYDTALQLADYFDEPLKPFIYVLYKRLQEGHICIRKDRMGSEIAGSEMPESLRNRFDPAASLPRNHLIIECEENLYLHRYFQYETKIIESIKNFLNKPIRNVSLPVAPALKDDEGNTDWQSFAIIASLLHSFTIITGGPGTGKTTTVAKILSELIAGNPALRIGLAAPTGKAAARMTESLQNAANQLPDSIKDVFNTLEPLTIHRLLGTVRGSIYFRHHADNPLPIDVLIVDECSMIDVGLFAKLLDAIGPDTRLILLGDRNQLASVEAGSLFGDLCDVAATLNAYSKDMIATIEAVTGQSTGIAGREPLPRIADHIIELQRSYRFSGNKGIGRLSRAIIAEQEDVIKNFIAAADEEVLIDTQYDTFVFENFVSGFEDYINEKDIRKALKKLNRCKVLCATREGRHGLYNTNLRIEKVLEEKRLIQKQSDFYEHRPVMITKNNYQLQLFNGDTGIAKTDEYGKFKVWFEINNELVGYAPSMISHCETAYAITIHKSQGSEFNEVLVLLPEAELPLLTRELVYTAVTRARRHVIIQSSETTLLYALNRSVERGSGIKYRLK